jgi:hypothetical protein
MAPAPRNRPPARQSNNSSLRKPTFDGFVFGGANDRLSGKDALDTNSTGKR